MIWSDRFDQAFQDIEEYKEYCSDIGEEPCDYVYGMVEKTVQLKNLSLENLIDFDDLPEDWDEEYVRERLVGWEEIDTALGVFNQKQTLKYWVQDMDDVRRVV